jgi:hypothetical protein
VDVHVRLRGHVRRGSAPVRSLAARLSVAEIDTSIEVVCDRMLTRDGASREHELRRAVLIHSQKSLSKKWCL